jgi:hypothetical protein
MYFYEPYCSLNRIVFLHSSCLLRYKNVMGGGEQCLQDRHMASHRDVTDTGSGSSAAVACRVACSSVTRRCRILLPCQSFGQIEVGIFMVNEFPARKTDNPHGAASQSTVYFVRFWIWVPTFRKNVLLPSSSITKL